MKGLDRIERLPGLCIHIYDKLFTYWNEKTTAVDEMGTDSLRCPDSIRGWRDPHLGFALAYRAYAQGGPTE